MDLQANLIAEVERQYRANLALLQSEAGKARVRLMQDAKAVLESAGFATHTQAIYNTCNYQNGNLVLIVHATVLNGTSGAEWRTALANAANSIGAEYVDRIDRSAFQRGVSRIEISTTYSDTRGYRPARLQVA